MRERIEGDKGSGLQAELRQKTKNVRYPGNLALKMSEFFAFLILQIFFPESVQES